MTQDLIRSAAIRNRYASSPTPTWFGLAVTIVLLLGVLNALAGREYHVPVRKAIFSNNFNFVNVLRYELVVRHAASGRWPEVDEVTGPDSALANYDSFGIVDVQMNRGSFNLVVTRDPQRDGTSVNAEQWNLSFLRQSAPGKIDAVALWICGEAAPPSPEFRSDLPNLTSVPREYLPTVCR